MERAIRDFATDNDPKRLAASLQRGLPAFRDDPFGGAEAAEVARLIDQRWQWLSSHDEPLRALAEGRLPTYNNPLDVDWVLRAAIHWADRVVEGQLPDALPPRLSPEELMRQWGISRATAYRVLSKPRDRGYALQTWVRAVRRQAVAQLVAAGRTKSAARRLLSRHPELIADLSVAPKRRSRRH